MKKYLKIIILICVLFVIPVKAEVIDMENNSFPSDAFYKSGDTFINVKLKSNNSAYFVTPYGYFYLRKSTGDAVKSTRQTLGDSNSIPEDFYIDLYMNSSIVGMNDYSRTTFTLPKLYNREYLWIRGECAVSSQAYIQSSSTIKQDVLGGTNVYDCFTATIIPPKYEVVCDNDNVKYGEETTCTLTYSYSFPKEGEYYAPIIDFTLSSDDYEIKNIIPNKYSDLFVEGNRVAGFLDSIEIIPNDDEDQDYFSHDVDCVVVSENDGIPTYRNQVSASTNCLTRIATYTYKLLKFTITPKKNESKIGDVKLSDLKLGIKTNDSAPQLISAPEQKAEVPMTAVEEVKGVEEIEVVENPKTGLNNYISLVVLAGMLLISIGYLSKYNKFKKIK